MVAELPCCGSLFWVYIVVCVVLVLFAGVMSGLTLGLMSLGIMDLEVLIKSGSPTDKEHAGLRLALPWFVCTRIVSGVT